MRLEILDSNQKLDKDFGFWLVGRIQKYFNSALDSRKLVRWNTFFEESTEYKSLYGKSIDSSMILRSGIQSLLVKKLPDKLVIEMNKNKFVPGLDRVRVDTTCRLITFGNTSVSGYPVILYTFQYFEDNINTYIEMYEEGIM